MSKNDYDSVIAELSAIAPEEVKKPSIPVSVYIQEAEDQKVWAEDDKAVLINHGLDWKFVEVIPIRAGALREAESHWKKVSRSQDEAEDIWLEKAPGAFELRDSLLSAFRYAFRKDGALLAKVALIANGNTREDMIQDLNDLAVIGQDNSSSLRAIKFDLTKLTLAASTSDEMAELLAGAKSETGSVPEELEIRNKAYTLLKEAVDEVRACGKYAFAGNESRLKGYRSEFLHKYNSKRSNETTEDAIN